MAIPPHRVPGDVGHISDHNSLVDTLTENSASIIANTSNISSHTGGSDPHGDRAYANATFSVLAHTHTFPVTSVNTFTGAVVLNASHVGAETPAGAQAKVDVLGAATIPLTQKAAANGVATLDGSGKIPSGQLPAGSGVTSVNGASGAVTLTAADVSAVPTTQKGAANGVATLDASTLVPTAQIPGLNASKITAGTIDIARIPTGTSSSTVSFGDHGHTYPVTSVNSQTGAVNLAAADVGALATSARGAASGVASLDGSTKVPTSQIPDLASTYVTQLANNSPQVTSAASTRGWARVDLNYTATGSTPDALSFYYGGSSGTGGVRTGYHNEYGELRARPSQQSTVALRVMGHGSGSTADIFQVTNWDFSVSRFTVSESLATFNVNTNVTGNLAATGTVTASNLPPFVGSGTTLPSPGGYTDGAIFLVHA